MANLTKLTLTSGVSVDSGDISTIDALLAQLGVAGQRPVNEATTVIEPSGKSYELAPVSATTVMGAAGAAGDFLEGILVIPAAAACGSIQIQDGAAAAITVFQGGGTVALPSVVPFYIPLGLTAVTNWKIITGANVTALGTGKFS